jgi:hypothetical protein
MVRFCIPPEEAAALAVEEYATVVEGRAVVLKIREGAMANEVPETVAKWQL